MAPPGMRDCSGRTNPEQLLPNQILLQNHAKDMWACDFLQATDLFFRALFAFSIIERMVPLCGVHLIWEVAYRQFLFAVFLG
jgi:hypothetical protein